MRHRVDAHGALEEKELESPRKMTASSSPHREARREAGRRQPLGVATVFIQSSAMTSTNTGMLGELRRPRRGNASVLDPGSAKCLHDHVPEHQMDVLAQLHIEGANPDGALGQRLQSASVVPDDGQCVGPGRVRILDRA